MPKLINTSLLWAAPTTTLSMNMRQVEKHVIKDGHEWFDYCGEITTVSRQLYNTAQFTQRQGFFYGWGT
jgi:hypothetical protein